DVDCFDLVEWDGAAPIGPALGRRRLVIDRILRLARDGADEREGRLAIAARYVAKADLRGRRVVGTHTAEETGRDAAHKPRGRSPTLRPWLRRLTCKTSRHRRPARQRRARRAPAVQGPQRSGRSYPP